MKAEVVVSIEGDEVRCPMRTFSSGKKGYGRYGKILIDGERYQVSCNIIKLE